MKGAALDGPSLIYSFLRDGAVTIVSPASAADGSAVSSRPEPSCKTMIQLDGNVITWISRAAIQDPELLAEHHRLVRERLREATEQASSGLRSTLQLARTLRWGSAVIFVGPNIALWTTATGLLLELVAGAATGAAWHFGSRFVAKRLAQRALQGLKAR